MHVAFVMLTLAFAPIAIPAVSISEVTTSGEWIALRADVTDGLLHLRVDVPPASGAGPAVYGVEMRLPHTGVNLHMIHGSQATEVAVSPLGQSVGVTFDPVQRAMRIEAHLSQPEPTPMQLLIWVAGEPGDWSWSIKESPTDATFVEVGRGSGAFLWDGSKASEGVHAHALVHGRGVGVSAANYSFPVEHRFRGMIGQTFASTSDSFTLRHPDGSIERCPCAAWDEWVPGEYTVTWSGSGFYEPGWQPIVVAGVDLPTWIGS